MGTQARLDQCEKSIHTTVVFNQLFCTNCTSDKQMFFMSKCHDIFLFSIDITHILLLRNLFVPVLII